MENAVNELFAVDDLTKKEHAVTKLDYTIVFYAAAAFLIGRAAAFDFLFPFAAAFTAAAVNKEQKNLYCAVFAMLGIWSNAASQEMLISWLFSVFVVATAFFLIRIRGRLPAIGASALAAVLILAVRTGTYLLPEKIFLYDLFLLSIEIATVFVFTYIFSYFIDVLMDGKEREYSLEAKASVLISLSVGVMGVSYLSFYGFRPEFAAMMLLVVAAGYRGGIAGGATSGLLAGTICAALTHTSPMIIGVMGFSGLFAGFFKGKGNKMLAACCFGLIQVAILLTEQFAVAEISFYEIGGAVVLFLLLPNRLLEKMDFIFEKGNYLGQKWSEVGVSRARSDLMEAARAFGALAQVYGRTMEKKSTAETRGTLEIFKRVHEDICNNCEQKINCWDIYDGRTEKYIKRLIAGAEEGKELFSEGLDRKNGFECAQRLAMSLHVKNLWEIVQMDYKWRKKLAGSRELLERQFKGVSEVFQEAVQKLEQKVEPAERVIETVELGISKYAKDGQICGDSCVGVSLDDDVCLFLISDGMGSGQKAAAESMLTINTLYQFLKAGFHEAAALDAMNSILILKSPEEIFATVDLGVLDKRTGVIGFYKLGAAAAFIRREDKVEVVKSASLPIGIIGKVKAERIERRLVVEDMILMVSDGIYDADLADGEAGWLPEFFAGIKSKDPQTVADLIMSKALERYGERERDDMTVMTVLLH